jgi:excisionase family DNA binding protein
MSDPLLTNEAAQLLKVSPETVRVWERTGVLPAVKTAKGVRLFARADVERLAAEREAKRRAACNGDGIVSAVA